MRPPSIASGLRAIRRRFLQLWSLIRNRMIRYRVLEHIELSHSLSETMVGKALRRVVVAEERAKTGDET